MDVRACGPAPVDSGELRDGFGGLSVNSGELRDE